MTVEELIKFLKQFPDDMQVITSRRSDYEIICEDEFSVRKGVEQEGWVMRSHPTMSEENKRKEKEYLYLEGN